MKFLFVFAGCLFIATPALAGFVPVPEPSTLTLLGATVVGGVLLNRLRRGR